MRQENTTFKRLWSRVFAAIVSIMALAGTGAILYTLWKSGAFLPRWIAWEDRVFCDASGEYEISLKGKAVEVTYGGSLIWALADGVKVQDALSWDIDNDKEEELVLLCWKIGKFGRSRPFWVKDDEKKWSQHLFVYEYNHGSIHAKWMSSDMGMDVAELAANGRDAPFAGLLLTDLEGKVSSWRWDSWGFTKEKTEVSFVVFGDNLIHEPIYRYGLYHDTSFGFLFEHVRDIISGSDVAVINQETPLTDDPAMYGGYPRFGTPMEVGNAIADAGFDVVTCATNHMLDRGADGAAFTKGFFDSHRIKCLGIAAKGEESAAPYVLLKRNNITVAMLNYTYGTNGIKIPEESQIIVHLLEDEEKIKEDIAMARAEADVVLVFAHWGTEYSKEADGLQQKWAQVFLEAKVDVVVGTHPHVLQPYEVLADGAGHEMLVYYSVGNFISAQSEETCVKGGIASFTISLTKDGYQVTEYGLQPLAIVRQEHGKYTAKPITEADVLLK